MFKPRMFFALIAITIDYQLGVVGAFNLSPVPNVEIKIPDLSTSLPQTRSSYFGLSIVLRENSILIGAPRAQSTLPSQVNINETGAIYRCPLNIKRSVERSPPVNCEPYIFESSSNLYYSDHRFNEVRDHQWLGATMDGGSKDDEPLLVCAPRFDGGERYVEDDHDYLHGICYRSENTLASVPVKSDFWKFKPLTRGNQIYRGSYYFQIGQMGFSAHITPDNEENIMGAPGINNWAGSVVRFSLRTEEYNIPGKISDRDLTLTGYAVASGYLNSGNRKELFYVTTSPHENMEFGEAYIYKYDEEAGVAIYAVFKGTQYGEYYGYTALVCDINGDELDDVLITAPQYRLDGSIDIGAIYVYVNAGNLQFQRQVIKAPFKKEARFGSTLMNLGDINHDGYNDIAVGAPLADGNGAVVIYLGSKNGLETQPSQFLNLPKLSNSYFGHGLSKGVDIDGNGYNDLAVGAPNNEVVYIYRTYPVIDVSLRIGTNEPRIELQAESIEYRVCFHVDSDMIVGLELDLIADAKLKRIKFNDNDATRLHVQVLAAKFEKCQTFNASITFLSSQVFVPLTTTVIHSLTNDGKRITEGNFCTRCAVLDPRAPNSTVAVVKYKHGCASEVCKVDLKIEALNVPEVIAGSSNLLTIKYAITNQLEKAFDTQVTITNSLNLTLARIPTNCHETDDEQVICDIAKNQLYLEDLEYLDIEFDSSNIPDVHELVITAIVTSMGNEQEPDDNRVEQQIQFKRYSQLEILGSDFTTYTFINKISFSYAEENLLILRDEETLLNFKYTCKLQNLGPSTIKNVNISLYIPIAYNSDGNGQQAVYMDQNEMNLNVTAMNDEIPRSIFTEVSPMGQEEFHSYGNVAYNFPLRFRFPFNRTLFQYCNESSTATCAKSTLRISILEAWKSLTLSFAATFKSAVIRDLLQNEPFLAIFVNVTAQNDDYCDDDGYLNITQLIAPIVVQYRMTPQTPLWIYVASIIGGILLLALLTLSLWKFGFFRRQSKEDMQQLWNEKLENTRAKEETELQSNGATNETFEDIDIDSRA